MKNLSLTLIAILFGCVASAQKVDYKANTINVDGKDIATVTKIKDKANFGLTSSFELSSLAGKKLVIATIATDFVPPRNDNSGFFYRFTFLTSGQVAIFSLSSLGPEKSFAKLIGESGIVVNDQLDDAKVYELIALKSRNPKVRVVYELVNRSRLVNVSIKENNVYQGEIIGGFKDISTRPTYDTYTFNLPSGLVVAQVGFTGGNGAQNCVISTFKDETTRTVNLKRDGVYGNYIAKSEGVDRNQETIKVIAKWLVDNDYL